MKKLFTPILVLTAILHLNAQTEKIYGGDYIDISEAPYQVSLEIGGKHDCGGVVLDCEWILTAAHCVEDKKEKDIIVHAGSTNQKDNDNGQRINVAEIISHPMYIPIAPSLAQPPFNDIALLRLSKPLVYSNNIQPITYATSSNISDSDVAVGELAFISGWGDGGNGTEELLKGVSLPIYPNLSLICDTTYSIGSNTISFYEPGVGAGKGDSGGPAVIEVNGEKILIGISSYGGGACGYVAPSKYTDVSEYTDFIDSNIMINECESCADFALDYQLVDDEGNSQTTYCLGDDMFVDVLQIENVIEYHIDLWTVDDAGVLDWISGDGWTSGTSPDGVNVIDLFENDEENPITFQTEINYVLKIAISTPQCGWVEVLRSFTLELSLIEPADFLLQDESGEQKSTFCLGEDIWIDGSPTIGENEYDIYAWRIVDGEKEWIDNLGPITGNITEVNISEMFRNLDIPHHFSLGQFSLTAAYFNVEECKLATFVDKEFEVECCIDFFEANFSPEVTVLGDGNYSIEATNFHAYPQPEIVHEWYLMNPDDGSIVSSSLGGFQYSQAEFGKSYFLIHRLRTPCGEICFVVAMEYEEGGQLLTFGGTFDCSVLDLDCSAPPIINSSCGTGAINWDQVVNADGYAIRIYYNQGECCDTPLSQPDELVNLDYTQNSYHSLDLANARCFTIQIGVLCDGEVTWGAPQCKECCLIGEAPTDLAYNCLTNQGSFSPVTGAEEYIIEIIWNDDDCFCSSSRESDKESIRIGRETDFNLIPKERCFSIRVGAKCDGHTAWSDKECYDCFDVMPRGNDTSHEQLKKLTISPNSANSKARLQVSVVTEENGVYSIYSLNGVLMDQHYGNTRASILDVSKYPSGIYFIQFVSDKGVKSEVEKLLVNH